MKNIGNKINLWLLQPLALVALFPLNSCNETGPVKQDEPSTIQFSSSSRNVTEGSEVLITLSFTRAVSKNELIEVNIETNAIYDQHFATDPQASNNTFVIDIKKGHKFAQFKVTAINNTLYDKSKTIKFRLSNPSPGLKLGVITSLTLTIDDDEGPSLVNFEQSSGILYENNSSGLVVKIPLTVPASGEGSIILKLDSEEAVYGTHFTTVPEATNNSIAFNISPNQAALSFTVLPVNNDIFTSDLTISISVAGVAGVVEKGSTLNYALTIKDDEQPSVANFLTKSGIINEDDASGITVEIPFSRPTDNAATIKVIIASNGTVNYGQDFITEPSGFGDVITFNVLANQSNVSFKVLPIDNSFSNYHAQIHFTLSDLSRGLRTGTSNIYDLTIMDNEIAEASFADSTGSIDETNTTGQLVTINFSKPLSQVTRLIIQEPVPNSSPQGSYSTIPELTEHHYEVCPCEDYYGGCYCEPQVNRYYDLQLEVPQGAQSVEFTITPVNNSTDNSNQVIRFILHSSNESPTIIVNGRYTLTIIDDD